MIALELFKILFFKDINIFYMLLVFVPFILLLSISGNFIVRILLEDNGVLFVRSDRLSNSGSWV